MTINVPKFLLVQEDTKNDLTLFYQRAHIVQQRNMSLLNSLYFNTFQQVLPHHTLKMTTLKNYFYLTGYAEVRQCHCVNTL